MTSSRMLLAAFAALGVAAAMGGTAAAQSMQGGMGQMGMMQGCMGPGMMQSGMGAGAAAPFGVRVTPMMNLSVEDVRSYLDAQLERLNIKRLKLGDIKAEGNAVTADIVTVDNSLVQRLKIDRRTGAIEYEK